MSYSVAYSTFANIPAGNHFWILTSVAIVIGISPSLFFIPCKHLKRYRLGWRDHELILNWYRTVLI